MPHGWDSTVAQFMDTESDAIVGSLARGVFSTGISEIGAIQEKAWRQEIGILKSQLKHSYFADWHIILEYEIPRRSRRPDVILLGKTTIVVIEFKIGAETFDAASRWQVISYALDLCDFHSASSNRKIVPVLCATQARSLAIEPLVFGGLGGRIAQLVCANASTLGVSVAQCIERPSLEQGKPIDPLEWIRSPYRPTPTIIEAASQLYEGHSVREISHRYAHNLDTTTDMLLREVATARTQQKRVICFVTGVPGSGKTLTGLNVVHARRLRTESQAGGIFLSGNGPLVKILRAALVRFQQRATISLGELKRQVSTFVQNVHEFLRYYREHPNEKPHEHVVVFDEAQRAWDKVQMEKKQHVNASEATLLLDIMERLDDWAVVIALVGGGQEIFLGEAGLAEWGRALQERTVPWDMVASPEALVGGESVAGQRVFDRDISGLLTLREAQEAHLDIMVRSHRAQRWAEWVNAVLAFRFQDARLVFPSTQEFPCFVTRELANARAWLKAHHRLDPEDRIGLVATSKDHRMRAEGIERSTSFLANYPFEHWFLNDASDVRSSYSLEVAASEFECQGLELDWVGMCWGGELTPSTSGFTWEHRKFRGAKWQRVRQQPEQVYTKNRYRVLLTRARKGLVIWVPKGDREDPTRDPDRFDRVFESLCSAGVPVLEEHYGTNLDSLFV